MTLAVYRECSVCRGCGLVGILACQPCDGIGKVFTDGGPGFGCSMTLADRTAGEVVELGSGDVVKISWFEPRKRDAAKKRDIVWAFVAEFDAFEGKEHPNSTALPPSIGVRDVLDSRVQTLDLVDDKDDVVDPIRKNLRARQGNELL